MTDTKTIGKQIADYRKAKNLTQDELGALLGVSNQAVSKWETGVSLPDVLLLPKIADALGVTLEQLYGIERKAGTDPGKCEKADEFPAAAYELLFRFFCSSTKMRFSCVDPSKEAQLRYNRESLEKGWLLGCYSNTGGATILSDSFAFTDTTYKLPGSEEIFLDGNLARKLRYLSDEILRKVLVYQYKTVFQRSKESNTSFYAAEIAKGCEISIEDAEEALEKLILLNINVLYTDEKKRSAYYFQMQSALFALAIFKLMYLQASDRGWHIVRDTSMISDYAFES